MACLFIFCALLYSGISADLTVLLPPDGIPEGWSGSGDVKVFAGDALFSHIDGGAELYLNHGFVKLAFKDYVKGDLEIRTEIYDMGSDEGAAGVFGANTVGLETSAEYGSACSLDDYQIIFYRGRYYVSITCYDVKEELQQAMAALAIAVDKRISKGN